MDLVCAFPITYHCSISYDDHSITLEQLEHVTGIDKSALSLVKLWLDDLANISITMYFLILVDNLNFDMNNMKTTEKL